MVKFTLKKTKFVAASVGVAVLCITTVAAIAAAVWFYANYSSSTSSTTHGTSKDDVEHKKIESTSEIMITAPNRGLGIGDIAAIVVGSVLGLVIIGLICIFVFASRNLSEEVASDGFKSIQSVRANLLRLSKCDNLSFDNLRLDYRKTTEQDLCFCNRKNQFIACELTNRDPNVEMSTIISFLALKIFKEQQSYAYVLVGNRAFSDKEKDFSYILIRDEGEYNKLCEACKTTCHTFSSYLNNMLPLIDCQSDRVIGLTMSS
jgi:hypothetical protein